MTWHPQQILLDEILLQIKGIKISPVLYFFLRVVHLTFAEQTCVCTCSEFVQLPYYLHEALHSFIDISTRVYQKWLEVHLNKYKSNQPPKLNIPETPV